MDCPDGAGDVLERHFRFVPLEADYAMLAIFWLQLCGAEYQRPIRDQV